MIHQVQGSQSGEPNTWQVLKFADVGAGEVYMARFLELAAHMNIPITWSEENKKKISDAFYSVLLEGLTPAFVHLRRASELVKDTAAPILTIRGEFDSFYSKLWTAYKERFPTLAREMGYDIGFLFADKDDRFEKRGKEFFETHKLPMDVLDWLRENRNAWQNKLSRIRNKIVEHPIIPFEQVRAVYTVEMAQQYFDHCWDVIELFTAFLMALSLPADIEMIELAPPYEQNGKHRRFAHGFKSGMGPKNLSKN